MRRFLIVDGNSLVHRGFHAIPHLSAKSGEPINGVYGFALLFFKALKDLHPEFAAIAFDTAEPTFRDELFPPYKAHRVKAPAELYAQIPRVKELVRVFNLPVFELPGFEADDLIGALAQKAKERQDLEVIILTGDLDALQLVGPRVKVFAPKQGLKETRLYDEQAVADRYGLLPAQLVDYKALRGDPSDNIPGVKGIGEKTAAQLLKRFGTLEKILKSLPEIAKEFSPRVESLLVAHLQDARISQKLAKIVTDLPVELNLAQASLSRPDEAKLIKLFRELEFYSLLDKLPKLPGQSLEGMRLRESKTNKSGYTLVDTPAKFEAFWQKLKTQKEVAIDTETTSLSPLKARLLGIGISWAEGRAHYIVASLLKPELKKFLEDAAIKKIGHNLKYDYLVLKTAGVNAQGLDFDTMVAAYLLNPGARNFDLNSLAFREFGFRKTPITALIGEGKNEISMAEVSVQKVCDYCCEDADYTLRLKKRLITEFKNKKLEKIFYEIEMPLIPVLAEMEYFGVKINPRILRDLSREAQAEIEKLQEKIWKLSGEKFNIGSPQQLKGILFDKLGIPAEEIKKGKTGLSTAAGELEKLRGLHPVVDLIFDWRELSKLKNTYLDALPELINPATGRVHTSFNQTVTATGRLSSSDPNLQNIPIRTEFGRKIRRAFAADQNFKLASVDYSQIELRLAAHVSGDEKMIKVFEEEGDIHDATAREIFGLEEAQAVSAEMRRLAKTINFAVLYGASSYGISSRIPGVSKAQADDFIKKYFQAYPKVTAWLKDTIAVVKKSGYVQNELGRIRFVPEINSSQFLVRSAAERAAINMPLQSLAADIIKMAMNKLAAENLTSTDQCRLLLQVHDELVFEIAAKKVGEYLPRIIKIMSGIYKLKVPLAAEAKIGDNWEEMKKFLIK